MKLKHIKYSLIKMGFAYLGNLNDEDEIYNYRFCNEIKGSLRENYIYLGTKDEIEQIGDSLKAAKFIYPENKNTESVNTEIENAWENASKKLDQTSDLIHALLNGYSLQKIVNIAAEILGNPVIINNFAFLPVCVAGYYSENNELREEFMQASQYYHYAWYNEHKSIIDEDKTNLYFAGSEKWILSAVKSGNVIVAWISVLEISKPFGDDDLKIVEILKSVVSVLLSAENSMFGPGKNQDIFLRDLLSDIHLSREYIENVVENDPKLQSDSYCIIAVKCRKGTLDNIAVNSILKQIRLFLPHNPAIFHERHFAILITKRQDEGGILNTNHVLRVFLTINNLQAGMSKPFSDLLETKLNFNQAISTLETLGELYPEELLIRFSKNLVFQSISELGRNSDIRLFIHPALEILQKHDKESGGDLFETLAVYLQNVLSPGKTAEQLFIHRNTLSKRLQKISELCKIDFNDHRIITQLLYSFCIVDYIKANNI